MSQFSSIDNEFLKNIKQIVDDNLGNENYSVEELAKNIGLSRSMLYRRLKRLTGKSASEYIKERRLTLAKKMLEDNAGTVSEIACNTGFNSPSYFTKVFKKYYQITPGELRKDKKATSRQALSNHFKISKRIKWAAYGFGFLILTIMLTWAGFYLFNEKANRSDISIAILPFDNLSQIENT